MKKTRKPLSEKHKIKLSISRKKRVGALAPNWKGGRVFGTGGYAYIRVEGHPRCRKRGHYVLEHRHVMEQSLGRYLDESEVVDHINGIKSDNRIKNLRLFENQSQHIKTEAKRGKLKKSEPWKLYKKQWANQKERNALGQFL